MKVSILFSAVATLSACAAAARFDPEQCGPTGGNQICKRNQCCSQYGWCGTSDAYCQSSRGCNSAFGRCSGVASSPVRVSSTVPSPTAKISPSPASNKNERCGSSYGGASCLGSIWGSCCSQYGWCGTTSDHCKTGCQPAFGTCSGTVSSSAKSSSRTSSSTLKSSFVGSSSQSTAVASAASSGSTTVSIISSPSPSASGSGSINNSGTASSSVPSVTSSALSVAASSSASSSTIGTSSSLSGLFSTSTSMVSTNLVATPSASGVARVWTPARNPSVDRTSADRLIPANVLSFYYVEQSPEKLAKIETATLASDAKGILLEDIATIDTVTCSGSEISITFTDSATSEVAATWPSGTLLFTLVDGCNTADERGVYLVNQIGAEVYRRRRSFATSLRYLVSRKIFSQTIASLVERILQQLAALTPTAVSTRPVGTSTSVQTPTPSSIRPDGRCVLNPAPSGSVCFTLTGHGASHIDGKLLSGGASGDAKLGIGYTPMVFYTDPDSRGGTVGIASSLNSGYIIANPGQDTATPWMKFEDPLVVSRTAGYEEARCSLGPNKSFLCSIFDNRYTSWTTYKELLPNNRDSMSPMWGQLDANYVPLTFTYDQVNCPAACSGTKPTQTQTSTKMQTQTSTKTQTSTPSLSSSTPTPTPSTWWCGGFPKSGEYAVNGFTWDVRCLQPPTKPFEYIAGYYVENLSVCMDRCRLYPECIAINFSKDMVKMSTMTYQCQVLKAAQTMGKNIVIDGYRYDSAYLIGPAGGSSAASPSVAVG